MPDRVRIAFVKFGGLAAGGTERWLQMMAANLPTDRFTIDYFYCDAAPYIGSDFRHPDTDPDRRAFMEKAGVNLVRFAVGAKDITTPTHDWVDTDFWEVFDQHAYDLVQTAKAGPAEYPYHRMRLPVVEYLALSAGVDRSSNIAFSINLSQWQRRRWLAEGGDLQRSGVIPIPAEPPADSGDLRNECEIPRTALVAGFHQRPQNEIFSPIPLQAFADVWRPDRYFMIMGGGTNYREQAVALGLENVIILDHRFRREYDTARQISQFLNTLDVFAHGRRDGETFGAVFAEAMMHGKPCLSHQSPIANAQPETMGPAGLFATDTDDYAAKLDRLFSDEELRARLAAKARPHAERYYSVEGCVSTLENIYEMLVSGAPRSPERPTPYGQSDLGFLVAGALEDSSSVAHHVMTGAVPHEPVVDLLILIVPLVRAYEEVGSANTLLALVAAHRMEGRGTCRLHASTSADVEALRATIGLNNWEGRLLLDAGPAAEDIPREELRAADLLTVNAADSAGDVVARLALRESSLRPALLLHLPDRDVVALIAELEALGYHCRRIRSHGLGAPARRRGRRAGWFVCFHPGHHSNTLALLPAWVSRRRAARRRRIRTAAMKPLRLALSATRSRASRLLRVTPLGRQLGESGRHSWLRRSG